MTNQNLGFQPNLSCKECTGSGYRVGSNIELCKICSVGSSKSGLGTNQTIPSQKLHWIPYFYI